MILVKCTPETQPAVFYAMAQNPATYELLGWSDAGTEYTGSLDGYQARIGNSNALGTFVPNDPQNPDGGGTIDTSTEGLRTQFNAWVSELRRQAYQREADHLLHEAYRMDIDPKENASSRNAKKAEAVAIVDAIKARFPKA